MYPRLGFYIDGEFRDGKDRPGRPVINPATGETIASLPLVAREDLDLALRAAHRAFPAWRSTSALERATLLRSAAALMRERAPTIAHGITLDNGKPLPDAVGEVVGSAEYTEWNAEECRRIYGRVVPPRQSQVRQLVLREPVGVCVAFTPWNFPFSQAVRKVAAALGAGCTVILKGPEESPSAVVALAQVFHDAGLPPGVLNVVWGVPHEISGYLIPSPLVRKVAFTGSVPVGKQLAALAGAHMKRMSMELGGHSPVLVFDDADVERAAEMLARFKVRNAGQICVSPTRFYVQDGVYDRFSRRFTEVIASVKVGNGMDPGVQMGPLVQMRRVHAMESLVEDAGTLGATVACGGHRLGERGHFFAPTVLTDVPDHARVMQEEPFGPVAPLTRFRTIDEVLQRANSLPFGLAAYVFCESIKTSTRVSNELEAGLVNINHFGMSFAELPFGGVKDSGMGSEGGSETFDAYLVTKMVTQV